jgi:hypothetical protein
MDREGPHDAPNNPSASELKDPLRRLLRRTTSTSCGTRAPLPVGGTPPTLLNFVSLGLAVAAAVPPCVTSPEAGVGTEDGVEDVARAGVEVVEPVVMARTVADDESTPRRQISSA